MSMSNIYIFMNGIFVATFHQFMNYDRKEHSIVSRKPYMNGKEIQESNDIFGFSIEFYGSTKNVLNTVIELG